MNFIKKKIQESESETLREVSIDHLRPYELLPTPLYCFLESNKKFVALKGPLDFFTNEEKEKFKKTKKLYLTSLIDELTEIKEFAKQMKDFLLLPEVKEKKSSERYVEVELEDASFIRTSETLKNLSSLWNSDLTIEPYFINVYCCEIFGSLDKERLLLGREKDVELFEHGVFFSSIGVFMLMHYGCTDYEFLKNTRLDLYDYIINNSEIDHLNTGLEFLEFIQLLSEFFPNNQTMLLSDDALIGKNSRFAKKLISRLSYRAEKFIEPNKKRLSLFDESGFLNEKV